MALRKNLILRSPRSGRLEGREMAIQQVKRDAVPRVDCLLGGDTRSARVRGDKDAVGDLQFRCTPRERETGQARTRTEN